MTNDCCENADQTATTRTSYWLYWSELEIPGVIGLKLLSQQHLPFWTDIHACWTSAQQYVAAFVFDLLDFW
jgi:hypothetical protein